MCQLYIDIKEMKIALYSKREDMQKLAKRRYKALVNKVKLLIIANKDGYLLLMNFHSILSGNSVSQTLRHNQFPFAVKIAKCCYKTINKMLRNITRGVNKDD